MIPLEKFLERALRAYESVVEWLSLRSREHANQRTIFILLALGASVLYIYLNFVRPPDNFPLNQLVTIEEGTTLRDVSMELEKNSVVRSALAFRIAVTITGHEHDVHAGDYLFKEPRDFFSVARAIVIGAYGLEPMRIRIPEGATTKEMAMIFGGSLLRFNSGKFIEEAGPLEGFLFPDTYYFFPNVPENIVIETMKQNFDAQMPAIQDKINAFGKPLQDVVTMASLLEREARITRDRRMIAGVLWNRLNKGMLLQVDAAFLYTLGKGTFQLTTKDLTTDSPYNTYRNPGLPPGPIGSPGIDSIVAAVTPIKHDYLYYLADKNGVTHYSKTYAEHLRYKRKYID